MIRKIPAIAVLLLLLSSLLPGAAGAEGPSPATPTDLECAHERTKTIIYFFDSPAYTALGPESHRVSGPAEVEVVCAECGEVLSSGEAGSAEEIRPHRMKNGACVLCGYKDKADQAGKAKETPAAAPGERVILAAEDPEAKGLLTLTLTNEDLYALSGEGVSVVLVRGGAGGAAVALNIAEVLKQTEPLGAEIRIELAEREDGSLFAGVTLAEESGNLSQPESEGIILRFYRQSKADVRISLAPAGEDTLIETEGVWNERGYWSVPYLREGTYFLLQ